MANKKAEILTMDGQVVSPITLATNVLLDDGRTAQDLLDSRDESMFSPTITTSSSISKVGQGDNVDFSENVIDGAYKTCVLKGKTLVNYNAEGNDRNEYVCMPSVEGSNLTVNGTVEGKVKSAILKGQTLVNYATGMAFNLSTGGDYCIGILKNSEMTSNKTITIVNNNSYGVRGVVTDLGGRWIRNINISAESHVTSTLTSSEKLLRVDSLPDSGILLDDYANSRFIIYDGNFKDGIYFEGMQSVRMPVLTTCGKNLFDGETERGFIDFDTGNNSNAWNDLRSVGYTEVIGGNKINIYVTNSGWTSPRIFEYDKAKNFIKSTGEYSVVLDNATKFVRFNIGGNTDVDGKSQVMLYYGEANSSTTYEPYKSNILTTSEDVVLRGIGEVRDELNLLTGELLSNFDEITFDGSENWIVSSTSDTVMRFYLNTEKTSNALLNYNAIQKSDKFHTKVGSPAVSNEDSYMVPHPSGSCWIVINKNKLISEDLLGFKNWLKSNKPTFIYQTNPTIKTVVLSDNVVYSYKDTTHYTCSSEEGSLIPTLTIEEGVKYKAIIKPSTKYSVVFNRTEVASGLTVDLGGATANITSTTLGKNIVQITTPPTLSHNYVIFKGLGNVIKDVQVIEGDVVGDEPYFEGMCDVKNPVMTNCNMLDVDSVDYKSNTVTTNKVVLRSLPSGVSDTLDLETGEYVQRIGEIVLDGSEEWVVESYLSNDSYIYFKSNDTINITSNVATTTTVDVVVDKLGISSYTKQVTTKTRSYFQAWTSHFIGIERNSLETNDVNGIKRWLSQNPITVQYPLETPIITTIDLKQHPYAYKDGYVVLTSSSEEVSLTPTIEYSLIANRLGQIQTNQKLVEKQQAQIDELESMVITNLVNTQYQQALNEIKLGVK